MESFLCGSLSGCWRAGARLKHHFLSEYGFSLMMCLAAQFTAKVSFRKPELLSTLWKCSSHDVVCYGGATTAGIWRPEVGMRPLEIGHNLQNAMQLSSAHVLPPDRAR